MGSVGNMALWKRDSKIGSRFLQMWRELDHGMFHDIKWSLVLCRGS